MANKIIELKNAAKYYEMGDEVIKALVGNPFDIQKEFDRLAGQCGYTKALWSMDVTGSHD